MNKRTLGVGRAILIGAGVLMASGCGSHAATADVTVTSCAVNSSPGEGPVATLAVVNHSSKTSGYSIVVAFDTPDGATQLDTANVTVQNLNANQRTQVTATSTKQNINAPGKFICKLGEIARLAG